MSPQVFGSCSAPFESCGFDADAGRTSCPFADTNGMRSRRRGLAAFPSRPSAGSDGVAHPVWMDTRNSVFVSDDSDARLDVFAGYGTDLYTRALPAG